MWNEPTLICAEGEHKQTGQAGAADSDPHELLLSGRKTALCYIMFSHMEDAITLPSVIHLNIRVVTAGDKCLNSRQADCTEKKKGKSSLV